MRGIRFTLTGNGESVTFSSGGRDELILKSGAYGFRAADISYAEADSRGIPGSTITDIEVGTREIFMPLEVNGQNATEWYEISNKLNRICNPFGVVGGAEHKGVTLTIESPWGKRWITGYRVTKASSPWDMEQTLYDFGRESIDLTLRCEDPFFHSATRVETWEAEVQPDFFDDGKTEGGFPFMLADSRQINSVRSLRVAGTAPSYPTWVAYGPVSFLWARNATSLRTWSVARPLLEGQRLIVRTDPNRDGLAFEGPDGANWFDATEIYPDLWPLRPGTENLYVRMDEATVGARVQMTYEPSWLEAI